MRLESSLPLEESIELLRRCRRHMRGAPASQERDRARKQLKRLRLVLGAIQRQVLAEGVTEAGQRRLARTLAPLDQSMEAFLAGEPRRGRMKALRWLARDTRRVVRWVALDDTNEEE